MKLRLIIERRRTFNDDWVPDTQATPALNVHQLTRLIEQGQVRLASQDTHYRLRIEEQG